MKSQHPGLPGPSRRAFLGGSAPLGAALTLPAWPVRANPALRRDPRSFRVSLSVSPFTEAVLGSLALTDGRHTASTVRQVQQLFNLHGATEVFARVATRRNASSGDAEYGMARAIERAQLARDLGMPLNPELGLWPVYGDIGGQPPPDFSDYPSINLPGSWTSLALPQMEAALRQYGALVAQQILATGVRVNYWDLGNEVDWGVAGVAVRGFNASNYIPPDAVDPAIGQMTAARHASPWAASIYGDARDRGKDHPHAVRILARAWIYVIWRCWQDGTAYDPAKHNALQRVLDRQHAAQGGAAGPRRTGDRRDHHRAARQRGRPVP